MYANIFLFSTILYSIIIRTHGQTWQISSQCEEGQSYIGNSCQNCTVGKYSTNNIRSTCEDCTAGKYNPIEGASECVDCPIGRYSTIGAETCTRCQAGKYQAKASSTLCLECLPGQYTSELSSSSCTSCPRGYYHASSGARECSQCPKGWNQMSLGSALCTECRIGTFWSVVNSNVVCQNCPQGYYQEEKGYSICSKCPSGYSNDDEQSFDCRKCPTTPSDGNICIGWGLVNSSSNWTECPIPQYSTGTLCVDCPIGFRSARLKTSHGYDSCVQCGVGKEPATDLSDTFELESVCASCVPGRYGTHGFCKDCEAGTFSATRGMVRCKQCPSGFYKNSSGQQGCSYCPKGWANYLVVNDDSCHICRNGSIQCMECPSGKMAHIGQPYCTTSCPVSSFVSPTISTVCETCQPGHQYTFGVCTQCPSGYVKMESPICQRCPQGYVNNSNLTHCVACDFGSVPQNRTSCLSCPVGLFAPKDVAQAAVLGCTMCQTGKYSQQQNTMLCKSCEQGQYQDEMGSLQCKTCLSGTFAGSKGLSSCNTCSDSSVSVQGSSACTQCVGGKGVVRCHICGKRCAECPHGTEEILGICEPCQEGKSRNGTEYDRCQWCAVGKYSDESGLQTCKACPSATGLGSTECCTSSDCATCDRGKFFSEFQNICSDCLVGRFGEGGASSCQLCPIGYRSTIGRTHCVQCISGFVVDGDSCKACPMGYFEQDDTCITCPRGYYQNVIGSPHCESCSTFKSTASTATILESFCEECDSRYVIVTDGSCDVCPFGHYYDTTDASHVLENCKLCPAGWESSTTTTCRKCSKNEYSDLTGQCKSCPHGFSTTTIGARYCVRCSGAFCSDSCPEGQYKIAGTPCKECPTGYISLGGYQKECTMCSIGRFQDKIGQKMCKNCLPGKYSQKGANQMCRTCTQGQYQHIPLQGACLDCDTGKYTELKGQVECRTCKHGRYTSSIRTNSSENCKECPKGWMGIDDGTCAPCPEGTWQASRGETVCITCNTTGSPLSPPQSTSPEQCFDGSGLVTYVFDMEDDSKEAQEHENRCEIRPNMVLYCPSCTCNNDARNGYWDGPVCGECRRGFAGGRVGKCLIKCPGYDGIHDSTMCGGLGKCWYGKYGSGECLCGGKNILDASSQDIVVDVKTCPAGRKCPGYGAEILKQTQYKPFYYLLSYRQYSVFVLQLNQYTPFRGHMWFQRYSPQNIYENVCSSCAGRYDSTEYTRVGYFDSEKEYKLFNVDLQVKNGFHGENCQYECAACLNNGHCVNTPHPFYYSYEYLSVRPQRYNPVFIPTTQCVCSATLFDADAMCCPHGFEPYLYYGKRDVVPYFEYSALPFITEVNDNVREYWLDDDLWLQNKFPEYKEPTGGQIDVSNTNRRYQDVDNIGVISVDYKKYGPYNKHHFYGTEKELCRACPGLFGKGVVSRSTKITTENEAEQYWWDSSAAGRKCNNLGVCDFYGQKNEKNVLFMGEHKKTSSNIKYKIHQAFSTCNRKAYKVLNTITLENCINNASSENVKSFAHSSFYIFSDKTRVDLTTAFTIKPEETGQQIGSYGYVEKENKYYSLTAKDGETWPTPDSNGDMIYHPWSEGECVLFDALCTETEIVNNARFNLYRLDRTGQGSDRLQSSTFNRLDTCFTFDDGTFKTKIGNFVTQKYKNGQDPFLGELCPKGHFCTQTGTGDNIVGFKESCPPGYFQPFFGITRQNQNVQCSVENEKKDSCQENLGTNTSNDYVDNSCQRCERNEYSPEGASVCHACPAGRIKKLSGNVQYENIQMYNIPKDSSGAMPWYYISDETGQESSDCALVPNGIIHVPGADKYMSNEIYPFISAVSCPFGYSSRPGTYVIQGHEELVTVLSSQSSVIRAPFGSFDSQFAPNLQKKLVTEYCFHCPGSSMTGPATMSCTTCFGDQLNSAMKSVVRKLTEQSYIDLKRFGITNYHSGVIQSGVIKRCGDLTLANGDLTLTNACEIGKTVTNLQWSCSESGLSVEEESACEIGKKLRRLPTSYDKDIGVWETWGAGNTVYLNKCEILISETHDGIPVNETVVACMTGLDGQECNYNDDGKQRACILGKEIRYAQDVYKNIQIAELVVGREYNWGGSVSIEVVVDEVATVADAILYCNVALPRWKFIQQDSEALRFKCLLGGGNNETWDNTGNVQLTRGVYRIGGEKEWASEYPLCNTCVSGEYRDALSRKCISCPAGYQSIDSSEVSTGEASSCRNCEVGRFSLAKTLVCSSCSPGQYQNKIRQASCLDCPKGYYTSTTVTCIACGYSKFNDMNGMPDEKDCKDCPSGQYGEGKGAPSISDCKSCPLGKVPDKNSVPHRCATCSRGRYSNTTECKDCASGQYQEQESQTSCMKCQRGRFQEGTNHNECKHCPGAWMSEIKSGEHVNADKCKKCLVGHVCNVLGGGGICEPGRYFNGKSHNTHCKQCDKGMFSNAPGMGACIGCPKGWIRNSLGAQDCDQCPLGQASERNPKGPCKTCPLGYKFTYSVLAPNHDKCVICPQGWEGIAPSANDGFTTQADCQKCKKQEYEDGEGSDDCKWCPKGYDTRDDTGSTSCKKCKEGTYRESARANDWWSCPSGWYSKAGASKCKQCPFGTWTRNQRGWSSCLYTVTTGAPKYYP